MGILLDAVSEAQDELMTRLDAILVEIRHVHVLIEAIAESRAESGTPAPV